MTPERTEDMFVKLVEIYADLKANMQILVTKDDCYQIQKNCPATKKHRVLVLVGAMLTGAGIAGGFALKTLL